MKRFLYILAVASTAAFGAGTVTIPAGKLHDQIRGGMLGHMLGDLNGLKHEMRYIAEPGNVESYVPELADGAWTDDDTDIEWIYIVEMQRAKQLMVPPARIAELWKRHINRRIWCSHKYLRQLLEIGIQPPLTGSTLLNPWADFNLSAQFVSESFGLISPGMPQTAARTGGYYTHVSIEGEPTQSTQMFAAMVAAAFLTNDVDKVLDAGLAATDPASRMHASAAEARRLYKQYPKDWRATRRLLKEKYMYYGGNDMRDRNGVLLNGSATVAALLYGHGDFTGTLRHAFNFGWDADNNAATAGAIVGVMKGWKWMTSQGWTIKDQFRNTSRDEMPMDETITRFGDRLIAVAEQNIAEHGGRKTTESGKTVYRIRTEAPAVVEKLPDFAKQAADLRARLKPEIETAVAKGGTSQALARAAYLAICLDEAPAMKQKYPDGWAKAIQALAGYPGMMQEIFHNQVTSKAPIRDKAAAAGLVQPARAARQ
jgi:ADP-ribosylglycohydrolase